MPQQQASNLFVQIEKIKNGVVYLKKGGVCRIVMVSGINFDLKSEEEQNLILNLFQNFLNTLDFSAQFFIHSRKVNIERYLEQMKKQMEQETNALLKIQIEEYITFIRDFIEGNQIINKTFFVVVPHQKLIEDPRKNIFKIFDKKEKQNEDNVTEEEMIQQLAQRVEQVISGLQQIDLRAIPLEDEELIELFYNIYNPQLTEKKGGKIADLQK